MQGIRNLSESRWRLRERWSKSPPSLRETLKTQLDAWLDEGEVTDEDLSALFYPYYVSESSVEAPATDIIYYVLFGGLYLAWFVYAWVALENVQKEET